MKVKIDKDKVKGDIHGVELTLDNGNTLYIYEVDENTIRLENIPAYKDGDALGLNIYIVDYS